MVATAMVMVQGSKIAVRTLCDHGSQSNVITEQVARDRGLKLCRTDVRLAGFFMTEGRECMKTVLRIRLAGGNTSLQIEAYVIPEIRMKLPKRTITDAEQPSKFKGELADAQFRQPGQIEMVLGAGVMALLTEDESRLHNGYRWQKTQLGWLVYGGLQMPRDCELLLNFVGEEERLDGLLERLWQMDEVPTTRIRTAEEEECEKVFRENVERDETGRYIVRIPTKRKIKDLGSTWTAARRRFLTLEKRFERDPVFKEQYSKEIRTLLENGYMKRADKHPKGVVCYLPHHAVMKKFRVVFDASCKSDRGLSLNECQLVGERLQEDLFNILQRFRTHRIAVTADIKKMYLQIKVPEDQFDLQRVLWREKEGEGISEYWLTRVTFGMSSAPHSAVRAMLQCADDFEGKYPAAAAVIKRDFYMDDCLTGCESVEDAKKLVLELKDLLAEGGFPIGKWHSNVSEVAVTGSEEEIYLDRDDSSVLGLRWLVQSDELSYLWKNREETVIPTKRGVVQDLGRIFDPLGFIGPVTAAGKIIVRELHANKLAWDSPLPEMMLEKWNKWRKDLGSLQTLRIRRWIEPERIRAVHGFADASELAYGAVVYVEYEVEEGSEMMVLSSKSRVAPLKTKTIPRLELCAALLSAKLMANVIDSAGLSDKPVFLWSDSTIVLHWLKRDQGLKLFVHNRVQKIKELTTEGTWGHISTELNPADHLSRGMNAEEFRDNLLWWKGPDLRLNKGRMLVELSEREKLESAAEYKRGANAEVNINVILEYNANPLLRELKNTSSLTRLIRKMAWIKLFIRNCKRGRRQTTLLKAEEIRARVRTHRFTELEEQEALWEWVRLEQTAAFEKETEAIKKSGQVAVTSRVAGLKPFMDMHGLLRISGRLNNSGLKFEEKHPVLIPGNGHLAVLVARFAHWSMLHAGYQTMAVQIRKMFWITSLRQVCRAVTARCVVCIRYRAKPVGQLMGELPAVRVTPGRAFECTGLDYAGPFEVKPDLVRSSVRLKKWVAVFICMKSRQIHLELVADLTSNAFIRAFSRFTSVRNPCLELWSDNATTFVGAEKKLNKMVKSWLEGDADEDEEIKKLAVKWRYISPRAPHQGGIWEAAVKSMKYHLYRVVGQQTLNSEEWQTLLAQVSAVVNSRPLMPMSDDPDDLEYLTPNHLATGGPARQLFGMRETGPATSASGRHQLINNMLQGLWRRWSTEFIMSQQERKKWTRKVPNLKVGDLVILMEDNIAPTCWKIGRVKEVLSGADGLVRNVKVKTAGTNKLTTRCVQKLALLVKKED